MTTLAPASRRPPRRSAPRRAVAHHAVENAEVARIFGQLADLLEIQQANPFRIRAYRAAARTVGELPHSVDALAREDPAKLAELPGIGKDLAGKIVEIVETGTLATLRDAAHQAPAGAAAVMQVPGLGPKRARMLCEKLGVRSLAGLRRAAHAGRIRALPGFGTKTEQRILAEIERKAATGQRVLRSVAAEYGGAVVEYMRALPGVGRVELAGSFRRGKDTVGDLDLLVAETPHVHAIEHFVDYPEVESVLAKGTTRASIRLRSGLQIDLRVLPSASYGAGLHYFTGSKAHNIAIRRLGQQHDLKINEYGVFRGRRRLAGAEEEDVFRAVGLPWIPPELREDRGEIEAAFAGKLPGLIELRDIHGDLHVHTTDSDGRASLEAMADLAQAKGYEYMAVTDHTPRVRIAGGLDRRGFLMQRRRIDALNGRLRTLTILAGAEVDILADGRLDLDDATLASLDVVLVALHSHLMLSTEEQTRRIIRALQHPSVDVLAHPTGRILNGRVGATFDLDRVFQAAAENGVMLEIDAQPERLDLDDVAARAAAEHGALLTIDTDAHGEAELDFMPWGITQARRAWVTKRQVGNTRPLQELQALLHHGRHR